MLCLAGLDRALGVQAAAGGPAGTSARYAVAHYYSASPTPDARPLVRERRFDADAPTPRGQLRHALRFRLETTRAQLKRDSKRLYERFLGTY